MSERTDDLAESRVAFPGPFSQHDVVVSGYSVPFLHAQEHDGGMLTIVLDNRFGLELSVADAERVVPFIADAISVALGYSAHPSADDPEPFTPQPYVRPRRVVTIVDFSEGNTAPPSHEEQG